MKKYLLLLILNCFVFGNSWAQKLPVHIIQHTGDSTKRMNMVFLSEGYVNSKHDSLQFINDINSGLTVFFNRFPYSAYKNNFNLYYIWTPSHDSGVSNPSASCGTVTTLNTFYGSYFSASESCRGILFNVTTVNNVLNASFPKYTFACIICNSKINGGISEGSITTVTNSNGLLGEILCHEAGHQIGGLGDEYSYGYPPSCCVMGPNACGIEEWNCTQDTSVNCRWNDTWPGGIKPIAGHPGLILGCNYCTTCWWKDSSACQMNALGYPFCPQCKKRLIYAFDYYVNPINSFSPALTATTATGFTCNIQQPTTNTLKITWTATNGATVYTKLNSSTFTPPNGTWAVKLLVQDTSHWLYTTAAPSYSENWASVTVSNTPPPPPTCGSPQAITTTNITQTTAVISWANVSGVIYNAITPDGTAEGIQPPLTITSLSPGSTYSYTVQANCSGLLSITQGATFTTLQAVVPPAAPTGLTTANGESVSLTCTPVAGASAYHFLLNNGVSVTNSSNSAVFTGLPCKTALSVTVTVTTANGTSAASQPFSFTTP